MRTFAQRITSNDRIRIERDPLHAILVDPDMLAQLTPLVQSIEVRGDRWEWQLIGINALGIKAAPRFTTVMDIAETRIAFEPADDTDELAAATGAITVEPDGDAHTVVAIDLTATVELPLPRLATRAVQSVMFSTMKAGGARFAENLLRHLGDPPHRGLDVRAPGLAVDR